MPNWCSQNRISLSLFVGAASQPVNGLEAGVRDRSVLGWKHALLVACPVYMRDTVMNEHCASGLLCSRAINKYYRNRDL